MAIEVFVNRLKRETEKSQMSGREILALAGFGEDHELFKLQGEGDSSGGEQVPLDQVIPLKPGMHFRAIPGNRNFG